MNLCKGVFWMTEENAEMLAFPIPCDTNGTIIGQTKCPLNSKTGTNYNHRLLWESLSRGITGGKPFDYYPRGRVEIRNAKASVYLNPDINTYEIQSLTIQKFGLTADNGIKSVRFISDGSNHYRYKNQ